MPSAKIAHKIVSFMHVVDFAALIASRVEFVTFNRATGIATAEGNVVLLEADGQVLFADRAQLNQDFSEGIAQGMQGLLADNGRLAATAARRREGRLTEMFNSVYTTCDPCASDPMRAPLWQITAPRAQHDQLQHRVEYWDPTLQMAGIPVFWMPYMSHPDPTVKRASGILPPLLGQSNTLGAFFSLPYYHVIDDQSDATIEPIFTTKERAVLAGEYRRRFDSGYITFRGSGTQDSNDNWRGHILGASRFTVDDNWRAGFDLQIDGRRHADGVEKRIDPRAAPSELKQEVRERKAHARTVGTFQLALEPLARTLQAHLEQGRVVPVRIDARTSDPCERPHRAREWIGDERSQEEVDRSIGVAAAFALQLRRTH